MSYIWMRQSEYESEGLIVWGQFAGQGEPSAWLLNFSGSGDLTPVVPVRQKSAPDARYYRVTQEDYDLLIAESRARKALE